MTFKSFPLSSDMVSVSDEDYNGISGAHRILLQITAQIHRLDASHNTIGTRGAVSLFDGLASARRRFSSLPGAELWGMTEINVARNEIGDDGFASAMYYVSKDQAMRSLFMQANEVTLEAIADTVVERINASNLRKLSLTSNPLSPDAVNRLFAQLNTPHLRELHLSICDLPPSCVPAIVEFLRSPRSQKLGVLELNANALGRLGVTAILDAVESANYSVYRIGLSANNPVPARSSSGSDSENEDVWRETHGVWESDVAMNPDDPRSMSNQINNRLPTLQSRNAELGRRVRGAASRAIAPLRMIVNARAPTDTETAQRVLADVAPDAAPPPHFPLLELPPEVQLVIARHSSQDADALADDQWARLVGHAKDTTSLSKMATRMKRAQQSVQFGDARNYREQAVREAWLGEMGCEWWELEDQRYWDRLYRRAPSRRRGISPNGHPDAMLPKGT
ncbi:hypothetical protein CcaverHIS002_0110650 [Cutaneotrichosporon cavernicola]|uniref:RNI-like protein n=1 Tax=Cutaneotrichosporon cavernicola TaxID=279322 RepID=A0AA48I8V7_9TREE|nr:uncharacterized protein CcaverHIS019_0110550 [Cutaneotrichosporon cavernicola]BEI80536.1 hypothetical protein CcaverHIS002_0110650 [Cutaneotrichosporon cavernicola]BEI88337.1 hypothetical protein CcaverHIS019_0110550 [Cutaneotrichosporon cavernicola]BEI96110.1 hypothetical protein CcaverHIS631_0110590 [Cutaneotrichosporon cavernicola]BEJ03882.1 hypothetical protein CcaverHIS641_0110570 [Cutaneotrichosporon cavernicola]